MNAKNIFERDGMSLEDYLKVKIQRQRRSIQKVLEYLYGPTDTRRQEPDSLVDRFGRRLDDLNHMYKRLRELEGEKERWF